MTCMDVHVHLHAIRRLLKWLQLGQIEYMGIRLQIHVDSIDKNASLPDGELNPGLPRDRRGY